MTSEAARARRLLSVFRDRPMSVDPDSDDERRARLVPLLRSEVRAQHAAYRRRTTTKFYLAACAAAAALLIVGRVALRPARDQMPVVQAVPDTMQVEALAGESVFHDGVASHPLTVGERLTAGAGAELRTPPSGWVRLRSAQGLALALASETSLALGGLLPAGKQSHVLLSRGELSCDVPKLPNGHNFVVVTPDARVIVHGTAFTVRVVQGAGGPSTCVRVRDGLVSVQRRGQELGLKAGESSGCEVQSSAEAAVLARPLPQARSSARSHEVTVKPSVRPSKEPRLASGTLAAETELLQAALAAERRRDFAAARARLESLVARYPDSPLVREARQALQRVTQGSHGAR